MVTRRTLLAVTSTIGVGTTVGCLDATTDDDSEQGDDSDGNDDPAESGPVELDPDSHPAYANWVQARTIEEQFSHIDFDRVESSAVLRREPMEESDGQYLYPTFDTPATAIPAELSFGPFFVLGVMTQTFPFLDRIAFGTESVDDPVATAETITHIRDGLKCTGEIDVDVVSTAAESLIDDGKMESHNAVDGYDIYTGSDPAQETALAVDEQSLIVGVNDVDPIDHMTELLDAYTDPEPTIDADLGWLLEHCESGALVHSAPIENGKDEEVVDRGFNVSDEDFEALWSLYADATRHVTVLDVQDDDTGHVSRTGVAYDTADAVPDDDEIVSVLAADATDTRVVTDGPRFMIEAEWDV